MNDFYNTKEKKLRKERKKIQKENGLKNGSGRQNIEAINKERNIDKSKAIILKEFAKEKEMQRKEKNHYTYQEKKSYTNKQMTQNKYCRFRKAPLMVVFYA